MYQTVRGPRKLYLLGLLSWEHEVLCNLDYFKIKSLSTYDFLTLQTAILTFSLTYVRTRQSVYVSRIIKARSHNHLCCWKAIVLHSVIYLAYNGHAPYCHLWPVRLYHVFPHCLLNSTICRIKLLNIKVFCFSVRLLCETFLILRRIKRDSH
jgi:hypothetical protein